MVESCSAINCSAKREKGVKLKFLSIPKDPARRKQWLVALRRENFNPGNRAVICENHFTKDDFEFNVHGNRVLKITAVPSVFNFPPHLQKVVKVRRPLKRKLTCTEPCPSNTDVGTSSLDAPVVSLPKHPVEGSSDGTISESPSLCVQEIVSKRRCRDPIFFGDFKETDLENEIKRKRFWKVAHQTVSKYKKLNKYYQCVTRRQKIKIKSLNSLLDDLTKQEKISSQQQLVLKESVSEVQKAILFRQLKKGKKGGKYSAELRCFALTLNFYSASAYRYVRTVFGKNSLPHPRTLAKWYAVVDGTPGYSVEALRAVKIKVEVEKAKGRQLIAGLMMDEMCIRQHVHWTGRCNVGYVDYGTGMRDSDLLPVARNVLVLMLVGYNSRWKVPIAYFLVDTLSAEEKAFFVKGCLIQLESTGVLVKSLTFDGCSSNISMANLLGANLTFPNTKPYFINTENNEKVYILLDACHMIKLIRNTLGDKGILFDDKNGAIKWNYFKELVKLQNESGLHCATRLRSRHIQYFKEKMKVKLAVQTFSASVADALEYCSERNITAFEGSNATINFCKNINNIFDFLNVRNFLGKTQCKKPLFKESHQFVDSFVDESINYLSLLKDQDGKNILSTARKTGFLGLIVCLLSVKSLFEDLVQNDVLSFLLTYKLSQDHLEMFFSAIRSRGGFSNNPTAYHFQSAYKRLLIHTEIASSDSANCLAQDNTSILNVTANIPNGSVTTDLLHEYVEFSDVEEDRFINNYKSVLNCLYLCDVVEYIAGFVSRKLVRVLSCNECASVMTSQNSLSLLLNKKNRGALCKPSRDVVKVCLVAESLIRSQTNFTSPNIMVRLIYLSIRQLDKNKIFLSLGNHFKEQDPLQNHFLQLIKLVSKTYFTIRMHHINSTKNEPRVRIRQHLTKAITFNNQ